MRKDKKQLRVLNRCCVGLIVNGSITYASQRPQTIVIAPERPFNPKSLETILFYVVRISPAIEILRIQADPHKTR